MIFINNNNNTQSERYFYDNKSQISNKTYFKRLTNSNHDYIGSNDPDYSNLLNQYKRDTNTDEFSNPRLVDNLEDIAHPLASRRNFNVNTDRNPTESWLFKNNRSHNSDDSINNPSDDEALENYLNDLAKNYDDIDRRIRNAEKFVNKIEESHNANFGSIDRFINSKNISNINDQPIGMPEKNTNYVSELRVNILDSLVNNPLSINNKDQMNLSFKKSPKFSRSSLLYKKPINAKHSILSRKPSISGQSNFYKCNYKNITTNHNYKNLTSEFQSSKSGSSSFSNSNKSDLELVNIPPPKVFSSNYFKSEALIKSKTVQTVDNVAYLKMFGQHSLEDRSVQTISPVVCSSKVTVDVCVGTESKLMKARLKLNSSRNSIITNNLSDTCVEFSDSDRSISVMKSSNDECSDMIARDIEDHNSIVKSAISRNIVKTPPNKSNLVNFKGDDVSKTVEPIMQPNIKSSKSENWNRCSSNISKFNKNKVLKFSPNHGNSKEEKISLQKVGWNDKINFEHENSDNKNSTNNASLEIQRLLENLGTHLQASMSLRKSRAALIKSPISSNSSTASFWDNPLHKNDLISTKLTPGCTIGAKTKNSCLKVNRANNIINSELQAICKTIEKNKKYDGRSIKVHESSSSDMESVISAKNNLKTLRSESLDMRPLMKPMTSPTRINNTVKKATSNMNLSGDNKFPSNFKVFRSFELSPYDDIIKAHLNPIDRRVKSVAAKNGCRIAIDGPINSYDPLSCQAFRNKVTYRCTVAGPNKENLDKCMNYLKETFPNTFLKLNARNA